MKGKPIGRARMNVLLQEKLKLHGSVLELGGGENPSYLKGIRTESMKWINADQMQVPIDLEKPLPYEGNQFDFVIAVNLLEHIFNYDLLIQESCRVLKNTGKSYWIVPLLVCYHPDPHDYFRYTVESLTKVFERHGYQIQVSPVGGMFQAAIVQLDPLLKWRILSVPAYGLALVLDLILKKIKGPLYERKFVLMYLVEAVKPEKASKS